MTRTRLIATAIILGSLQSTLVPEEACADHCQDNAVERLKGFGGKVDPYVSPVQQPSWSQSAKGLSSSEPKTVTFFNTNLSDLDLALVTDALLQIGSIKRLDLRYTKVKGECLGGLAGIATLEELDLSSTPISGEGLVELTLLSHLKCISINNTYLPRDSFDYFICKFAPSLKSLQLSGAIVFYPCLQPLGAKGILELIEQFSVLECLDLSQTLAGTGSGDEKSGISDLRPLSVLHELTELDLSNNNLNGRAIPYLGKLTKLTVLSLAGNTNLTDNHLAVLWPKKLDGPPEPFELGLNRLKKLNLSGTQLTDAGLAAIADRNDQLVELNISGTLTLVSPDSATSLGKLTRLKRLNISNTGVDDALFRAIWKGDKLSALDSLDISGTMVTDRGLTTHKPQLAVGFMFLKTIYCADTKVTTGGVNRRNALIASTPPPKAAMQAQAKAIAPRRFDLIRKDIRMRQ